jgi:outer membrane protein assembly factor BamB
MMTMMESRLRSGFLNGLAVLVPLALAACTAGGNVQTTATANPTSPPAAVPSVPSPSVGPLVTVSGPTPTATSARAADWSTYHRDNTRTGAFADGPSPNGLRQQWESEALDGAVYAEPLLAGDRVFAATEGDSVYALDAPSGKVLWRTHLGEPVPRSSLPCGNIDPTGVTGTPVIDPAAGVIYAVASLQPLHHELVALDLSTGAVRFRVPIDPPGADPRVHQQRAALALSKGLVYVSFGGRFGDCGNYHGWVLAASAADGSVKASYQVPTPREGAIWAPSGPAVAGNGDLFVATGNGASSTDFDFANAVIRLSSDLKVLDWFAPTDWAALSARDADLGSVGPAPLDGGLVFQIGKTGTGYLLRADHLGNIGGQVFQGAVCNGAYGGTAYAPPILYVPCRNGLVALRLNGESFAIAWRGPNFNAGPPVVGGGSVFAVDQGDGTLYALDARDGSVGFRSSPAQGASSLPHFLTPTLSPSSVFVSRGRTIAAFGPG